MVSMDIWQCAGCRPIVIVRSDNLPPVCLWSMCLGGDDHHDLPINAFTTFLLVHSGHEEPQGLFQSFMSYDLSSNLTCFACRRRAFCSPHQRRSLRPLLLQPACLSGRTAAPQLPLAHLRQRVSMQLSRASPVVLFPTEQIFELQLSTSKCNLLPHLHRPVQSTDRHVGSPSAARQYRPLCLTHRLTSQRTLIIHATLSPAFVWQGYLDERSALPVVPYRKPGLSIWDLDRRQII